MGNQRWNQEGVSSRGERHRQHIPSLLMCSCKPILTCVAGQASGLYLYTRTSRRTTVSSGCAYGHVSVSCAAVCRTNRQEGLKGMSCCSSSLGQLAVETI
jgi:hypothetical protein